MQDTVRSETTLLAAGSAVIAGDSVSCHFSRFLQKECPVRHIPMCGSLLFRCTAFLSEDEGCLL
jgi:hypothetical protein